MNAGDRMHNSDLLDPTSVSYLRLGHSSAIQQMRPAPAEVSEKYSDSDLYKIICAHALSTGVVSTKGEFDAIVRDLGNVQGAEELIAFRKSRFGCRAWRHGKLMVCDCGTSWQASDTNPPSCKP